MNIHLAF